MLLNFRTIHPIAMLVEIAAASEEIQRGEIESVLADIEEKGFMLRDPVRHIWVGERDVEFPGAARSCSLHRLEGSPLDHLPICRECRACPLPCEATQYEYGRLFHERTVALGGGGTTHSGSA